MITRRRVLAGTGGIAVLAAGAAAAQGPTVGNSSKGWNDADHTKRLAAVRQGIGGLLHWPSARRPAVPGWRSGARSRRTCHVRAGRAQCVAHASAWSDADRHVGARVGPGRGPTDRGDPARRCCLVSSRLKVLARGNADDRDDAHRHHGISERQERRLAREGQRRTIPALMRRWRATISGLRLALSPNRKGIT